MGVEAAFFGPLKYAILPDLLGLERAVARQRAGRGRHVPRDPLRHHRRDADRRASRGEAGGGVDRDGRRSPPGLRADDPGDSAGGGAVPGALELRCRDRAAYRRSAGRAGAFPLDPRHLVVLAGGATYLSQFPSYVRFYLNSEEAVVTLFLTVFSVGVGCGSLLGNRILKGRISAELGAVGRARHRAVLDRSVAGEPGRRPAGGALTASGRSSPSRRIGASLATCSASRLGRHLYRAFVCAAPAASARNTGPAPSPLTM